MRVRWTSQCGSITLVALSLAVVIGISLASYLALCHQALLLSTRTLQLSKARQLAESGLEGALWSLNTSVDPNPTVSATAWAGWSTSPTTATANTNTNLGEGAQGDLTVTVENFSGPTPSVAAPSITAVARIIVPGLGDFTKTLKATAKPAPLFANAIGIINNGSNGRIIFPTTVGCMVDSWDSDYLANAPLGPLPANTANRDYTSSTDYPGSNPGTIPSPQNLYPIASAPTITYPDLSFNYAAVVAAPRIKLNVAEIRGYVTTFGNPITSTSGTIQGPPPASGPSPGPIDTNRVGKSAFVPRFPLVPPGFVGTLIPEYHTSSGTLISSPGVYYTYDNLDIATATMTVSESAVIAVHGDLWLHDGGAIKVDANKKLEIYVYGNVLIDDGSGSSGFQFGGSVHQPKNLALFCAGTFDYISSHEFCGVIYSASTTSTLQIQGNPEIYGAILANYSIQFSGAPKIHYDTALRYLPKGWFKCVTTPFIIEKVTEAYTP